MGLMGRKQKKCPLLPVVSSGEGIAQQEYQAGVCNPPAKGKSRTRKPRVPLVLSLVHLHTPATVLRGYFKIPQPLSLFFFLRSFPKPFLLHKEKAVSPKIKSC